MINTSEKFSIKPVEKNYEVEIMGLLDGCRTTNFDKQRVKRKGELKCRGESHGRLFELVYFKPVKRIKKREGL